MKYACSVQRFKNRPWNSPDLPQKENVCSHLQHILDSLGCKAIKASKLALEKEAELLDKALWYMSFNGMPARHRECI